ncbi:MAG TPA: hypothetical protein VE544_13490 [Nitrososphaeraceae archaeon]|nr:hypothetical protein [Nitrososphaeraceae archaeon]
MVSIVSVLMLLLVMGLLLIEVAPIAQASSSDAEGGSEEEFNESEGTDGGESSDRVIVSHWSGRSGINE